MAGQRDVEGSDQRAGRATPSSCELAAIHAPGAIQSHGLLLAVDAATLRIEQVSANVVQTFPCVVGELLGAELSRLFTDECVAALRVALEDGIRERLTITLDDRWGGRHDAQLHPAPSPAGLLIAELEPALTHEADCHPLLRGSVARLQDASARDQLWELATGELRLLTGFDSVLVLLFDDDGGGWVVGEARDPRLPSLLGSAFSAREIPAPARELYARSWLRLVADVHAMPSPLVPLVPAGASQPLDLSYAYLRAVSPAHLEYLVRHQVTASMSVSLMVDGQLRGLLACRHHRGPRPLSRPLRDAAELFGQLLSVQLRALELAERNERALAERVRSAEQAKEVFIANVSHELRTPLNAITGWTSLLQSGTVPSERIPHAIEVIARNARAQAQLVDDLIAVSGMTTGQLPLAARPLDLREVVESALSAVRLSAESKRIQQRTQLGPGCWVMGDGSRLQQVALQLLSNAVKFTPHEGEIAVTLLRRGPEVELCVADSGRGISHEFLPRLFAPFRQQEEGPARSQQGLGLGLTMVRQLIERHGGRIEAESAGPGKGARFRVLLPALAGG